MEHKLNIAVRYFSRGGKTKKIADAIAEALRVESLDVSQPLEEPIDLLFVGGGIYAGKMDKHVKEFLLNLRDVKSIVTFTTSASGKTIHKGVTKALKDKSIIVSEECLHIPGRFAFFHKDRPNKDDITRAEFFAYEMLEKYIINEKEN